MEGKREEGEGDGKGKSKKTGDRNGEKEMKTGKEVEKIVEGEERRGERKTRKDL